MAKINLNNCKFYDLYFQDFNKGHTSCGVTMYPTVFVTVAIENPQKYLYQKLKSLLYSYEMSNDTNGDKVDNFIKYAKEKGIINNYKIISCTPIKLERLRMPNKRWG